MKQHTLQLYVTSLQAKLRVGRFSRFAIFGNSLRYVTFHAKWQPLLRWLIGVESVLPKTQFGSREVSLPWSVVSLVIWDIHLRYMVMRVYIWNDPLVEVFNVRAS